MAKPKLALIPSAQGSKFYSVLPSSGVGDFDFTRSSSATRINAQGLIETVASGVSRLNYPLIDGVVNGCPSHLLEPEKTNLQVNSEEFDNSLWSKTRASITPNDAISPSGLLNADKLVGTSGTTHYVFDGISVISGSVYTISVFAKYIDNNEFNIENFQQNGKATFNIKDGYVASNSGTYTEPKIENYGNGWYRCSAKFTANADATINYGFYLSNAIDKGIHIWGAQFELGDFSTSYIPTTTAISTRSAETAIGSGNDTTFGSEGVLFAEISAFANDGTIRAISITDGTVSNIITVRYWATAGAAIIQGLYVDGVGATSQVGIFYPNITNFAKIALSYQQGALKLYVNGTLEQNVALVVNDAINWNTLRFDIGNSTQIFYGNVKQVQSFNEVLTDAEGIALTTI